jgi:type I restriction enzyme S subunit
MSEWKECKLNDIAELSKTAWKIGNQSLPYIGLEHIEEGKLRLNGIGHSDEVVSNKYYFNQDTFLFGKLRPYFRKLFRPSFEGVCSTDIWVVKAKNGHDLNYLFYLFASNEFVDLAYKGSSGTRMPRADWKFMAETKWLVPPLPEQKAIAAILSSLDDKIDLLHRQNKTLEAMAETLFRQWFVEEVGEDWEEVSITDLFEIRDGTHDSPKQTEFGKPLVTSKHIHKHRLDIEKAYLISEEDFNKINQRSVVDSFDILFSMIGTIGLTYLEQSKNINYAIKNIGLFKTSQNKDWAFYTYLWLISPLGKEFIFESKTGSTQQYISLGSLRNIYFNKPSKNTLDKFNSTVEPLFSKIFENTEQIQTLTKLRDTLLPKLMSGEVRVKI